MRKISYIIIAMLGMIGNANAISDEALISQLVKEKNQKLATLEQCTKKVTGFKVAGISTLGLTAVGVVGNIALKNKNNEMDGQIASAKNELLRQQEKVKTLAEVQADCEKHKDIAKWDGKSCVCFDTKLVYDSYDGKCRSMIDRIQDINTNCGELVAPLIDKIQAEADNTYRQLRVNPKNICTMCNPECFVLKNTKYLDVWYDFCTEAGGKWDYFDGDFVPKTSALYNAMDTELSEFVKEYNLTATEQNLLRQKLINCIQSKIQYFKVSCKCD